MVLFKIKGKQLDVGPSEDLEVTPLAKRRNISKPQPSDKIGDVVMIRTDKHFIIKVKNLRIIKKDSKSFNLEHSKDYNERVKNTIVMSIKQGMKLLIDNDNDYQKVCNRLYYKYGRLMLA